METSFEKLDLHDYKPLREIVFESIREAIIDGRLKPGERVMEVQLAEKLGVSRTPVREAIRKLELEGLLVMVPRKGAYVADVSFKDIINVLEIRASLEGLAASLAAVRMSDENIKILEVKGQEFLMCVKNNDVVGMIKKDAEFHDVILNAAKNEKLTSIVESLKEQVQRFRIIYFTEYNMTTYLAGEHQRVIDAIKNRDSEAAAKHASQHIENIEGYIVSREKNKTKTNTENI